MCTGQACRIMVAVCWVGVLTGVVDRSWPPRAFVRRDYSEHSPISTPIFWRAAFRVPRRRTPGRVHATEAALPEPAGRIEQRPVVSEKIHVACCEEVFSVCQRNVGGDVILVLIAAAVGHPEAGSTALPCPHRTLVACQPSVGLGCGDPIDAVLSCCPSDVREQYDKRWEPATQQSTTGRQTSERLGQALHSNGRNRNAAR